MLKPLEIETNYRHALLCVTMPNLVTAGLTTAA